MVNIKNVFFICLMLFSCVVYAENKYGESAYIEYFVTKYKDYLTNGYFENKHVVLREEPTPSNLQGGVSIHSTTYRFKLLKKINESSGYFSITVDKHLDNKSISRKGDGLFTSTNELDNVVVIYYYGLKDMVDGDTIALKDEQRLYLIGAMTGAGKNEFTVFSFNKKDDVGNNKLTNRKTACRYCNGTGYAKK